MTDILIMVGFALVLWVFMRLIEKKPILPWKEAEVKHETTNFKKRKVKKKRHQVPLDAEPDVFTDLFKDIKEINNHMIRYHDNTFVLIAEVEPVNYFLLSQSEQEAIDVTFETWLAQTNYNVQFYLQNRYVDLTEPITQMRDAMMKADNLHENAIHYGNSMVEDLLKWQYNSPIFETKRYLIFTHQVKTSDITADNKDELEEKIVEKAFAELYRRMNTAKSQLQKARMDVQLLTNEGISEVLYHAFNRRRAVKNRFKDFGEQEILASYVTADQDDTRIELVKEGLRDEVEEKEEREYATANN